MYREPYREEPAGDPLSVETANGDVEVRETCSICCAGIIFENCLLCREATSSLLAVSLLAMEGWVLVQGWLGASLVCGEVRLPLRRNRGLWELRDEEAWVGIPSGSTALVRPADPGPVEAVEGQGEFLAALLARQAPAEARLLAASEVLELYGLPPLLEVPESFDGLVGELARRGLAVSVLPEPDLDLLVSFDYPALLPLRAASGELRVVALVRVSSGVGDLVGVGPSGVLRVPLAAIEEQWIGDAWLVWQPYLEVPQMIGWTDSGAGVLWIQEALQRLGDFDGAITGDYDAPTADGIRRFQRRHGLDPDGVAGPLTQMLLYGDLDEYSPPRLGTPAG